MNKPIRPSLLDRAVGLFSPGAMRKRVRERLLTDVMLRGYEAASPSRHHAGWIKGSTSADAEIAMAGPRLRDAMRDLVRNNPHAAKAVSSLVAYIVGDGIMPRANTGNKDLNKTINDLWTEFAAKADKDGQIDAYGQQALLVREMIEGGEVLLRRVWRRKNGGFKVPVQFQVLESDFIDSSREGPQPNQDGFSVQGIQFGKNGDRAGYWLHPAHPGNSSVDPRWNFQSNFVPASDISHVYEQQRTQVRGVPWGSPVINSLRDLADYEAAEITRKKIEACAVGVVSGESDDPLGVIDDNIKPGIYDTDGNMVEKFEPGMFFMARGGRSVTFHSPSTSGGYEAYKRASIHTIAAGFRIPYSVLSGDLSQNSYASQKVGMADFYRLISQVQWHIVVPMVCAIQWRWFCEAAYLAGLIPSPNIPAKYSPPKMPSADPVKDIEADIKAIRSGVKTLAQVAAERGETIDELIEEIKSANDKLDAAGVILDTDPRKTTQNGQKQMEVGTGRKAPGASDVKPSG